MDPKEWFDQMFGPALDALAERTPRRCQEIWTDDDGKTHICRTNLFEGMLGHHQHICAGCGLVGALADVDLTQHPSFALAVLVSRPGACLKPWIEDGKVHVCLLDGATAHDEHQCACKGGPVGILAKPLPDDKSCPDCGWSVKWSIGGAARENQCQNPWHLLTPRPVPVVLENGERVGEARIVQDDKGNQTADVTIYEDSTTARDLLRPPIVEGDFSLGFDSPGQTRRKAYGRCPSCDAIDPSQMTLCRDVWHEV